MNCGRCGRPIYDGQPICQFCRKTVAKSATRKTDRMNKMSDQQQDMLMNMVKPGGNEEEDATDVWAEEEFEKGKKGKR